MERSRKAKKSILIVLLLVVVGLSIGFAAFTSNLKIKSSATVTPNPNTFKVVFSSSTTESAAGEAKGDGTYGQNASFAKDAKELTGLKAEFTAPGQTATWEVNSYNDGEFDAFLNSVTLGTITCEAKDGTSAEMVENVVMKLSVAITDENGETTTYDATTASISDHILSKGRAEKVVVSLAYQSGKVDGDFTVDVSEIILGYDSVD